MAKHECSYSEAMARRADHVAQRCWTFKPSSAGTQETASPVTAADALLKQFRQLQSGGSAADQAAIAGLIRAQGQEGALGTMTKRTAEQHGEDFRAEVLRLLSKGGIQEVLDAIVASVAAASEAEAKAKAEAEAEGSSSSAQAGNVNVSLTQGGSATARIMARTRYLLHELGCGPDGLAHHFCGDSAQLQEEIKQQVQDFKRTGYLPGASERTRELQRERPESPVCFTTFAQNRTCFFDDVLMQFSEQYAAEPHNIVLLGAGFDTRFYRLSMGSMTAKFEVDARGTQAAKRAIMSTTEISPNGVVYVECDFVSCSWLDALCTAGMDPSHPTLVIWEGVLYYLPLEAVSRTLALIAQDTRLKEVPAAIAFDYFSPAHVALHAEATAAIGEPLLTGFKAEEMIDFVAQHKLLLLDHLTNRDAAERYLPRKSESSEAGGSAGGSVSVGIAAEHESFVVAGNAVFAAAVTSAVASAETPQSAS